MYEKISEVDALRCHICQDFYKLLVKDGWQQTLLTMARDVVNETDTSRPKHLYQNAYNKLIGKGPEHYSVYDMDVSFITELVNRKDSGRLTKKAGSTALIALQKVKEDRNDVGHSVWNEDTIELYLKNIVYLNNLDNFIKSVLVSKSVVELEYREAYYHLYYGKIQSLWDGLKNEFATSFQYDMEMEADFQKVIANGNLYNDWLEVSVKYAERYAYGRYRDKDREKRFWFQASKAGIPYAQITVLGYHCIGDADFSNIEGMLQNVLQFLDHYPGMHRDDEVKSVLNIINQYLSKGNKMTEGLDCVIEQIRENGYHVIMEEGNYILSQE